MRGFSWSLVLLLSVASTAALAGVEDEIVVTGDHVEYHEQDRRVIGSGHLVATYQETTLTCDRAVVYLATKDAFLSGRVRVTQPGGLLTGDEVLYNFETRKGAVLKAHGIVDPWLTAGDRVDKVSDSGFVARAGYLTSCDFETPHTRLQAKQVRIIPGDRVSIRHAVLYVGPIPILYLPSYTHPLDDRRPRVTLTPGYSKEWGAFLLSAWRYYFHEQLQGRIHLDYRERRDLALGVDTRYWFTEENEGILRTYYTQERRLGREHLVFADDKAPTVERGRYRLQWRHRWQIDRDTTATGELHYSKDDRFLQEFFEREFEEDAHPKTYLQVIRSTPRYGVSLLARKRVNRFETEIEQLPELRYDVRPTAIPWTRPWEALAPWWADEGPAPSGQGWLNQWYYQSTSSYNAFYRKPAYAGVNDHLHRLDTLHQISYQARLLGALNVTPFVATRQTWYSKEGFKNEDALRGIFETGVDVNTKFFRIFDMETDVAGLDIHRVRHVVTPNLSYRYRPLPTISPGRLPQFDGTDAIDKSHTITPQLEQKLQTKQEEDGSLRSVDLARLIIGTDYTFKRERDVGGQLGNFTGDLELKPYRWLLAETDAVFDTHRRQLRSVNFDLVATPGIASRTDNIGTAQGFDRRVTADDYPWLAGVGWRWQRGANSQVTFEVAANLGPKWRIGLYERTDLRRINSDGSKFVNRAAESEFRIRRDLHEWTAELIVNRRRSEGNFFLLVFRLKAFPDQPLEFERNYNRPKLGTRRALFAG